MYALLSPRCETDVAEVKRLAAYPLEYLEKLRIKREKENMIPSGTYEVGKLREKDVHLVHAAIKLKKSGYRPQIEPYAF